MKVPMTKKVHMKHPEMTMIIIHHILMIKITPRVHLLLILNHHQDLSKMN